MGPEPSKSVDLRNYLISVFYSMLNKVGPTRRIRYEKVKIDRLNNPEKVLGMRWLNVTDELTFNMNDKKITHDLLERSQKPTKR